MKKLILLAALATSFCFGQTGTSSSPFTNLDQAWGLPENDYHFNIGGNQFLTHVKDGWVLVVIDLGGSVGSLPTKDTLNNTSRGVLKPATISTIGAIDKVRLTGPTIDYYTTSAATVTRLKQFKPLVQGNASLNGAIWVNSVTGTTHIQNGAVDPTNIFWSCCCAGGLANPTLSQVVMHACGNGQGIQWLPYNNEQKEKYNLGNIVSTPGSTNVNALRIWVKSPAPANLPVELIHFGANCEEDGGALISWTTASEHNSDYYLLEQSNDGKTWHETKKEKAIGNSTDLFTYNIPVTHSENYFRLTQYDVNGRHTTYDVISLNCEEEGKFKVNAFPNPTKEYLIISISNEEVNKTYTAVLKDLSGVEVYRADVPVESGTTIFKTEFLIPGMYTLTVGGKTSLIVKL
jgi:hypothetical protein